jgi:hypothetical protein
MSAAARDTAGCPLETDREDHARSVAGFESRMRKCSLNRSDDTLACFFALTKWTAMARSYEAIAKKFGCCSLFVFLS